MIESILFIIAKAVGSTAVKCKVKGLKSQSTNSEIPEKVREHSEIPEESSEIIE